MLRIGLNIRALEKCVSQKKKREGKSRIASESARLLPSSSRIAVECPFLVSWLYFRVRACMCMYTLVRIISGMMRRVPSSSSCVSVLTCARWRRLSSSERKSKGERERGCHNKIILQLHAVAGGCFYRYE